MKEIVEEELKEHVVQDHHMISNLEIESAVSDRLRNRGFKIHPGDLICVEGSTCPFYIGEVIKLFKDDALVHWLDSNFPNKVKGPFFKAYVEEKDAQTVKRMVIMLALG